MFPSVQTRHLCFFVYLPYHRVPRPSPSTPKYLPSCLPSWEGWYFCRLHPSPHMPTRSPHHDQSILSAKIYFQDSLEFPAYITATGELYILLPAPRPPEGTAYEWDRRQLRQRVSVTQSLCIDDVRTGRRGEVRMTQGSALYVEGEETDAVWVRTMREKRDESAGQLERVDLQRLKLYGGVVADEWKWRRRRRWSRPKARIVQEYLLNLINRAARGDDAVDYVMERQWRNVRMGAERAVWKMGVCGRGLVDDRIQEWFASAVIGGSCTDHETDDGDESVMDDDDDDDSSGQSKSAEWSDEEQQGLKI